jgi:hypothetical protein
MTCKSCLFYGSSGTCRKNPPAPVHGFPMVLPSDWCGAYRDQAAPEAALEPAMPVVKTVTTETYEPVQAVRVDAARPDGAFWSRKAWKERLGL